MNYLNGMFVDTYTVGQLDNWTIGQLDSWTI